MPEFPVMQGLWLSMGRIDEVWMCCAEVSGELVQSVVSNKDTGRNVQHAVFSIEVLNGGAAASRVTFAKDLAKVVVQKLNNSIVHSSIAYLEDDSQDAKQHRGCSRPRAEQR